MVGYKRANSFVFDQTTSTQFKENYDYNMVFLKSVERYANEVLNTRGHIFLNEVLDDLGMTRTQTGALCGWTKGEVISFNLGDLRNEDKGIKSQPIYLGFNLNNLPIIDRLSEEKEFVTPEPINISPTRKYVIAIEDFACPNNVRFEKFTLPEGFWKNNSTQARTYYYTTTDDNHTRILACVAYEDYMAQVNDVVDEVIFEKPKSKEHKHTFDTSSTSLKNDMEQVRQMLDAWNDQQENPSTTYAMIMQTILQQWDLQNIVIEKIKGALKSI